MALCKDVAFRAAVEVIIISGIVLVATTLSHALAHLLLLDPQRHALIESGSLLNCKLCSAHISNVTFLHVCWSLMC